MMYVCYRVARIQSHDVKQPTLNERAESMTTAMSGIVSDDSAKLVAKKMRRPVEVPPDGWNIHMFVNFDEFLMRLSPNRSSDRWIN